MTVLWLIIWVIMGTPKVIIVNGFNNWGIALLVCVLIDFLKLK